MKYKSIVNKPYEPRIEPINPHVYLQSPRILIITDKDLICERLLTRIDETQGRVKLGSATFEITAAPDLDVKIHKADGNHS